MRSLMPRSSWERITPELPRAPMREPCPIALQTSARPAPGLDPFELAHHGLEGQGHVGPGVSVGHGVDVEAVDVRLVQPEGVAVAPHDGAQVVGAEGRRGGHGR